MKGLICVILKKEKKEMSSNTVLRNEITMGEKHQGGKAAGVEYSTAAERVEGKF